MFFCYSGIQLLANPDSCKNSIGFHFYQTDLKSIDNYENKGTYFTNNQLLSFSAYYNRTVFAYKRISLSLMAGLNYKSYRIGYLQSSKSLPPTTGNFLFTNNSTGFNVGLLAERPVVNYKNTSVLLGLGAYWGWVFNSKAKYDKGTFPSDYSNQPDEYALHFNKIKDAWAYSLLQIKIAHGVKYLKPYFGTRVISGGDFMRYPIASYSVYYSTNNNGDYVYTAGKFGTSGPRFEFFAGLSF